ncbi:MAG: D-glycero-beta-D-manno-heptose 1,7-bisphosphate 7-phosphatase [Candidatus Promineifilaceae bacterium]
MVKGIFLDRDGVIIENRADYVRSWMDVEFIPGAIEALVRLSTMPYKIVVVTNQSAVGRGIITIEEVEMINEQIMNAIRQKGGRVDAYYLCPHAPEEECSCRKPEPGMLLAAADDLQIDLQKSIMVGDALTDIQAGKRAGISNNYLVLTGRGMDQLQLPLVDSTRPFSIINSLADLPEIIEPII